MEKATKPICQCFLLDYNVQLAIHRHVTWLQESAGYLSLEKLAWDVAHRTHSHYTHTTLDGNWTNISLAATNVNLPVSLASLQQHLVLRSSIPSVPVVGCRQ